jgi:hypothetical protein
MKADENVEEARTLVRTDRRLFIRMIAQERNHEADFKKKSEHKKCLSK